MQNAGQPVPLNYGLNWLTGYKAQSATLQNTGDATRDYTRIGFWILGEGEMDGLEEMWDTGLGRLLWLNEYDDEDHLHFHPGCDANFGGYGSVGGDQGLDSFWQYLPSGLQPLQYHRWAYYAIKLKQLVNDPPNTNQDDASVWADVNPVGLWRGIRCRMFDSNGEMTGYAFTRNPAWHYVDLNCRRKLFPEYLIDGSTGAQDLPTAVRKRFDWVAIAETAAYFEQTLSNGRPRFCGDYSLSQQATLQANITQMLGCSRSFQRERGGTLAIVADKPRASVFTFTRDNADNFTPSDADVHTAPNRYVGKYRDLLVPAAARIASISCADHQKPVVTTQAQHCYVANDYIVQGGTDTRYDGYWQVDSVPNPTQYVLKSKGSNYPTSVGAGGVSGLRYSRFKERAPEFHHHAHQLTRGAVGVGIERQRNKVRVETDFANCTWDQVERLSLYQRAVALGPDVQPYIAPPRATLKAPLFAGDAAGSDAIVLQIEPGDVVTVDKTLSDAYAGLYEVMPIQLELTGSALGDGMNRTAVAGSATLTLRPYSADNYPDAGTNNEPGWPTVPVLPGGLFNATEIPLADGNALVMTGSGAHGDSIPLPSGYRVNNMLAWASPQGYIEADGQLHYIGDCDAYPTRFLSLIYRDGGSTPWHGDLNWMALFWRTRTSMAMILVKEMTYIELTLQGGEKMVFGKGYIPSGTQVPLPAGYVDTQTVAVAFPKSAADTGHNAHGFAANVAPGGIVHHSYKDGDGNVWEGPAQVMVVAYQNNMGTWSKDASGWAHCLLSDGKTLAIAGFSMYDVTPPTFYQPSSLMPNTSHHIPAMDGMHSDSIQIMPSPDGFAIVDHPAHGVKQCYVDGNLEAVCLFEDGEGNVWGGSTAAFALLCDQATGSTGTTPPPSGGTTWPGTGTAGDGTPTSGGGGGGDDTTVGGGKKPPVVIQLPAPG